LLDKGLITTPHNNTIIEPSEKTSDNVTAIQLINNPQNKNPDTNQISEKSPGQSSDQDNQDPFAQQSKKSEAKQKEEAQIKEQEDKEIQQLKKRDKEVKAHENAHKGALGGYAAGGISLGYTTGPDGNRYATSGEVPIDLSEESTPQQTMQKAQIIRRAALAPNYPSSADRQIAAKAAQMALQAQRQIAEEAQQTQNNQTTSDTQQQSNATESPVHTYKHDHNNQLMYDPPNNKYSVNIYA